MHDHEAGLSDGIDAGSGSTEPVKSVREEAWLLLRELSRQDARAAIDDDGSSSSDTSDSARGHRCPHGWCGLCAVVEIIRDNPGAMDQVTSSVASSLRALATLIEQAGNRGKST